MKNLRHLSPVLALITGFLFMGGCGSPLFEKPELKTAGEGILQISLSGANVAPALARTMLPRNPELSRYELDFTDAEGNSTEMEPYVFYNSAIQIRLRPGEYYLIAKGYTGDALSAQSDVTGPLTVVDGELTIPEPFVLKPYMREDIHGVLSYSLSWDSLSRMPSRAELLIETYADTAGNLVDPSPIPLAFIPPELNSGSAPGTILLLRKEISLVRLTGSLGLPPGEYRLTMSLTLDEGSQPVSRVDIAHVYSNLTTSGAFYYGGGDLFLSNASPDPGSAYIIRFAFTETPNATTVIGSVPGTDGRRLIMVMVPGNTDLKRLTPEVECAPGAVITSPLSADRDNPHHYGQGEIDFTNPTAWTAEARDGATQEYTVVVSHAPRTLDKSITYFFFEGLANNPGIIDQGSGAITVVLPHNTPITSRTPVISIIGDRVVQWDGSAPQVLGPQDFTTGKTYRVYAGDDTFKEYTVTVIIADDSDAEITRFTIDGYPDAAATITPDAGGGQGGVSLTLPYGVSLTNLTPLIQFKGKSLDPGSGVAQNFSAPVFYTVTAEDGTVKSYKVTITNEEPDKNTGIFDFVITNWPNCKVVIGQNPRADGKIPIVIQVPNGTDELNLIPAITLSSGSSAIDPLSGAVIPFANEGNMQEAVYTVTAQGGTTQKYVVVVSEDGQYYYVNGVTGRDNWPDVYNGESESRPFKTLAYAVYKASQHPSIDHIFVSGELNDGTEGGAWEDASVPSSGFHPDGSDSGSVFTLTGTGGKKITVTGVGNGVTLRGAIGKRVLSVTGGAHLVFENITVTGGDVPASRGGNGGGVYIGGNSIVKFSGGSITGNKAANSGGGVYVEAGTGPSDYSEFTLMGGSITGNTASGTATGVDRNGMWTSLPPSIAGGGGVCISGKALFWLASGTVSNNTTSGSGGGVLVRGHLVGYAPADENFGFIMSGGSVSTNRSNGGVSPHGGGGIYVATGEFSMPGGDITFNNSVRQGGGVFVHSGAVFGAWGNASIAGNVGVGSSKGICSRGVTTLMGSAQADTIYIWNPLAEDAGSDGTHNYQDYNEFSLAQNARVGGIVLAYSSEYRNHVNVINIEGTGQIGLIDLEGHLTNGKFVDTDINDWLNRTVLKGGPLTRDLVARFPLGAFVGGSNVTLAAKYKLGEDSGGSSPNLGKLVKK
jgi:hypothetical protein